VRDFACVSCPRLLLPSVQGLLNKKPADRLGWPDLLDHPFVRETEGERLRRERALADAIEVADSSRAWRVRCAALAPLPVLPCCERLCYGAL
jgi:hypothetical protein